MEIKLNTATDETALLIPSIDVVAGAFDSPEKLLSIIEKIEADCRSEHLTAADRPGRERIKSLAYKIARSKTAMDDVGKGLTEEAQALVKRINAQRKIITDRLDALKVEIRAPLTAWEAADDLRKQGIKDRIATAFGPRTLPASLAELRALQDATTLIELDDTWGEFLDEAARAKDSFMRHLTGKIGEAERLAAQEEELARLREAQAQREREDAERAERERVAAEEKAKADAEIAKLRAELEAAKQTPLPEPVGEPAAEPVAKIDNEIQGRVIDPSSGRPSPAVTVSNAPPPVAEFFPVEALPAVFEFHDKAALSGLEAEITAAVLGLIENYENHEDAAARIAVAIIMGEIPNVEVKA